jgi:carboxyl-terminal processing protease
MMPAQNRAAGMNLGFPDVCNTIVGPATVPIPYPNIAMNAQATGFAVLVKVNMVNALHMSSQIPMTSGDEAGTAHPTIKGAARYTMGSPIVFIEKMPAIHLLCTATGNQGNCPIAMAIVPSSVNVLYTDASPRGVVDAGATGDRWARRVDADELAELGAVARRTELSVHELAGGVLRIAIASIGLDAAAAVGAAVARRDPRGLVLDLRGCRGGALDGAIDLAGSFLAAGALIALTEDEDGDTCPRRARAAGDVDRRLVILVDERSASAAELVAASLQGNLRAPVVGAATAGKGRAQRIGAIAGDGRRPTRSVGTVLGPDGSSLEGAGVRPDVATEAGAASLLGWAIAAGVLT